MTSTSVRPSSYNQSSRDPNTAAMLSLFLPGLGQMYNGETRKGMLFMCVSGLNLALFLCLIFNRPILEALLMFGASFHMKPNGALATVLSTAGLFTSVGFILTGFFLTYIAYAVRDAYDHAALKRRRIYPDFVIELPEANAGSYIFHFSIMVALFVIAFFFIIPLPPKAQITDIEFVQNQLPDTVRPKVKRKSDKNTKSSGQRNPNKPVQAAQPDPGPKSQPAPQKQQQQAQPKAQQAPSPKPSPTPTPRPSPAPTPSPQAPSPAPAPMPTPAPMPRVNSPSPSPSPSPAMPRLAPSPTAMPRMAPSPMAMPSASPMPMAGAPKINSASPMPSLAPSRLATAGTSTGTPSPIARPTGGSLTGLPSLAPSPVAIASSAGVPGFAPSPRSSLGGGGGSSNVGAGVPAPVTATSGGGGGSGKSGSSGGPSPVPVASGGGGGGSGRSGGGPSSAPAPTRAGRGGGGGGWSSGPVSIMPSVPKGGGGGGDGTAGNPDGNTKGPPSVAAQADVDFGPYMAELQRKIKRCWFPPRGQESRRVSVVFKIHSDGTMSNLRIEKTSGMDSADTAALQAVQNAAPFRPLPAGAPSVVDIQFTFDYNVFGGGRRF